VSISVVVPTFDMAEHLAALWASFERSGLLERVDEVVIVNDGSRDGTRGALEALRGSPGGSKLRPIHLPRNVGRFRARLAGAEAARGERLLFLDTRLVLPLGFGAALAQAAALHPSVMGAVDVDVTRSVFCLYWDRSHQRIFRRHYADTKDKLTLTRENYDRYLKGTGVFLCERSLFLATSARFDDLFSDDTFLMREMVATTPITLDPAVRVSWVPREDARAFLARILERGPGFVEYHVLERRGAFFWAVVAGGCVLVGSATLTALFPPAGPAVVGALVGATALSTALFARSVGEAVRMAPLHVAVVGAFGLSVLYGLAVNGRRHVAAGGRKSASAAARAG
jgi:hypothetical protein